jgi:hypothetical protein
LNQAIDSYEAMKRIVTIDSDLTRMLQLYRVGLDFGSRTNQLFTSFCTTLFRADYDPKECLQIAYNKIKDRTGATLNGEFVKD